MRGGTAGRVGLELVGLGDGSVGLGVGAGYGVA